MEILKNTILQFIPGDSRHASKCVSFNCPCCVYMGEPRPDSRGRGGLFIESDHIGYNCFNCGFKFRQEYNSEKLEFNTRKFMELLGVPSTEINRIKLDFMKKSFSSELLAKTYKSYKSPAKVINLDFKSCDLPKGTHFIRDIIMDSHPDSDVFKAFNYAEDRGIADWPYLLWSSDKNFRLNERLMIPFLHKERIVGFTARMFHDKCKKSDRYYTNNPNTGNYVFNIDALYKKKKYVIVNESPIDSILYDGVATMNFEPTRKQCDIINNSPSKKILVPDLSDSAGKKFIDIATNNSWGVYIPKWDSRMDLGKATHIYGKLYIASDIIVNHDTNPIKIKVKANIS